MEDTKNHFDMRFKHLIAFAENYIDKQYPGFYKTLIEPPEIKFKLVDYLIFEGLFNPNTLILLIKYRPNARRKMYQAIDHELIHVLIDSIYFLDEEINHLETVDFHPPIFWDLLKKFKKFKKIKKY